MENAQYGERHVSTCKCRLLLALIVLAVAFRFLGDLALKPEDVFSLSALVTPIAGAAE